MTDPSEAIASLQELPEGKKVYFASDFHLGAPSQEASLPREKKIIKWLEHISHDAAAIFLVGDIFDFWFEYKSTIPKGFIRFQGKLAELRDRGIAIYFFAGNHDMWMFDYFTEHLQIPVFRNTISIDIANKKFLIGHGDGLGPGDWFYKFLKSIFTTGIFKWAFQWLHPNIGMWMATGWSLRSRKQNDKKEDPYLGEREWLLEYARKIHQKTTHDYYIFGHRHMPLQMKVADQATYYNLGEWVNHCTYLTFDGKNTQLSTYRD